MASKEAFVYHVTWPLSSWAMRGIGSGNGAPTSAGLSPGVTFVTSPAHPWAGADGEQWLKFDANDATSHKWIDPVYSLGIRAGSVPNDGAVASPPDATVRWAQRLAFPWRHGASAGVGDANPTSAALIVEGSSSAHATLKYNTDRTWTIAGVTFTATSAAAMATLTDYLIELWCVWNYSDGSDRGLLNRQWVLRAMTPTGGSVTTLIDTTNTVESGLSAPVPLASSLIGLGEVTQRGANFHFYIGSPASSWEDADNPVILRGSQMVPNSMTGVVFDEFPGNFADVDESGTAVPSSADFDSVTLAFDDTTKRQFYQLTAPNYPVSGDSIRSLVEMTWFQVFDPGKTGQNRWFHGISDGTNTPFVTILEGGPMNSMALSIWNKNPAGGALVFGDLAGIQGGVQAQTTITSGSGVVTLHTLTMTVVYANQTDTITIVPGTGSPSASQQQPALMGLSGGIV